MTGSAIAQSIHPFAGGYIEEGRPATLSELTPSAVALDGAGNLYVADTLTDRVRRIELATGVMTTIAGRASGLGSYSGDGGPATLASLWGPSDVAVDRSGNVFIADFINRRIRKVDALTGIMTTVAGNGVSAFSGDGGRATMAALSGASEVAVDDAGNLYLTDGNRIRKVTAATGIINTIAGSDASGYAGDGGPASLATLDFPSGVAVDSASNLYIADGFLDGRVRKIAASSGVITTVAGGPMGGFGGDGGPATAAGLGFVRDLDVDPLGNLYVTDASRIRMVNATTGIINTVAGGAGSSYFGDNGPATAALLNFPEGVTANLAGDIFIADTRSNLVRMVRRATGVITTIGGRGSTTRVTGDGGPATASRLKYPSPLAVDTQGNVYIGDNINRVRMVDASTGVISTVATGLNKPEGLATDPAGNVYISDTNAHIVRMLTPSRSIKIVAGNYSRAFSGDGGPATQASLNFPAGLVVDSLGNLLIADQFNNRIRKVDLTTGVISTVAGNGSFDRSGDGGPATLAGTSLPFSIALDVQGNLYFDTNNSVVRKVNAATGVITTYAGNGTNSSAGDNGPATLGSMKIPSGLAVDRQGNLYIADEFGNRIRRVDASTGIIRAFAGTGEEGLSGDLGPATLARFKQPKGLGLDATGNLYIADYGNDRVRRVPACVPMSVPQLTTPAAGSSGVSLAPRVAWQPVASATHYDVLLNTANPPQQIVATDVAAPTYNPSNLEPLTTYYWKVIAKGDPFCVPFSTASSEVFSFTTTGSCSSPAPFTGNATVSGAMATITWQASARASFYDLYLGSSSPPRLYTRGVTATTQTINDLAPGTTYNWKVVAHASCDTARTVETSVGSFTTAGNCGGAGAFNATSPNEGDTSVPSTATLSWAASAGAASYDVYLGSGSNPPLYLTGIEGTSVAIPRLTPGAAYSWKIVASAACDPTRSAVSPVRHFIVASCGVPAVPQNVVAPQNPVAAGSTYTVRWNDAAGLDAGGSYLVERASDAAFGTIIDHQQTIATSASFVAKSAGTYYHHIRAIAGCDATKRSAPSDSTQVTVSAAAPVVVFSMLPQAVITKLGDKLEDQTTRFALENLGTSTVQVLVGSQLTGSVPFFTIVDPSGGDAAFVTLEPHKPKTLEIDFSGPPNDRAGSYQGGIYVASTGQPLAFTPQAYVNLKVGGDTSAVAPKFLVSGIESEFAYFPPVTGDDSGRPAVQVDLLNSGTVPMEVAGEIGPEAWLKMEKDWNASAVPASAFRTLRLSTQRTKAVAGSALPRYTYLTVRNKAGQAARLLVEDSGGITNTTGRSAPLGAGEMSFIVPFVASGTVIIVTNSGSDPVPLDLVHTPEGGDGFDASAVLRTSIVIPPNDMVSLTDPLVQIFGKSTDASGSIEILSPKLAQLAIRAEARKAASGGGVYTAAIPVAIRGEGARAGSSHRVAGITSTTDTKTSLTITETSGRDKTTAHIALYDNIGTKRGEQTINLGRYAAKRIDDIAQALAGGAALSGARVDLDIPTGGGAVMALAVVTDRTSGAGAAIAGRATAPEVHLSSLGRPIHADATTTASTQTFTIPGAITNSMLKTTVGLSALAAAVNATVALRDSTTGQTTKQMISVAAGQTSEVDAPSGSGTVVVTTDAPVSLYARVRGTNIADALPVVSAYSEGLTGGGSTTPLYADGLEHSIDPTRGRKTSLILTELAGQSATVNVRLYEPGSRTAAVAEKDFTISANGELRLDNLFASMGLESDLDPRKKNQLNVAAVVTATGDTGVATAQAVMTDNKTGDRRTIAFVPAGGVPATALQRSATNMAPPPRRRTVGR